ncbi:MAG: hypothetical protein JWP89_6858 [Schlesneria sp.]|nr:hypothetical protein [Schlesneria sp.]
MSRLSILVELTSVGHGARFAALMLAGIGLVASAAPVQAQAQGQGVPARRAAYTRDDTRGLIDDYSESLQGGNRFGNSRRPAVPNNPGAGITAEMKQIRPLIHSFAEAASQLTYSMNEQITRFPGLRSLYSDALTVSAEAIGLDRHAAQLSDHRSLLDDFEQLDADWRELAYKLQNVRGLPAETRDAISDLTALDQQIRKSLNTQPQINRQDLALEAAGLAGDLENLQEDISAELGRTQQAQQYLIQAGRSRQQILAVVAMSRDSQYDTAGLVREFKQYEAFWQPLAAKLQAEDNRYLERGIRRISLSTSKIHQLLLLPQTIDKAQLVYMAATLKKDIDDFFSRTPLIMVMHLPKASRALATADQFYGVCEHFVDQVNRGEGHEELVDSFRYIEEADHGFTEVYAAVNSDKAVASLQRIEQTVATIRTSLHIQREDFDRTAAIELAASIANLTEQLDMATKQWLANDNQSFTNQCRQETATLVSQATAIHNDLVRGVPVSQLQREIDLSYDHWRTAYKYLVKCQTEDRPALGRLSGRLTPALVELRTMISQSTIEQTAQRPVRR